MVHKCETATTKKAEKPLIQAKSSHQQDLNYMYNAHFRMPFDHVTVANKQTLAASIVCETHTQNLPYLNRKIPPSAV